MNTLTRVLSPFALLASTLALVAPAVAQESAVAEVEESTALEMRADQIVALINGELDPKEVFTESFLNAVPPAQLAAISQQLTSQYGAAVAVESLDPPSGTRAALAIRMERAIARGGMR